MTDPNSFSYKGQGLQNTLMDLAVRFILNCPPEDLSSSSRFMFQVEEAHWFYEDFAREEDHELPYLSIYHFVKAIYCAVPYLSSICGDWEQALIDFKKYKQGIPVRGGIILNETNEKVLLVSDWNHSSWGFPRGKINKQEEDMACAIREVYEETGFNMGPYIQSSRDYLQRNVGDKNLRFYVAMNVPNSTKFETRTRKEISSIKWFPIAAIAPKTKTIRRGSSSGHPEKSNKKNQITTTNATHIFYKQLRNFLRSKSKVISKSRSNARDSNNLKSMLGIKKPEDSAQETRQELLSLLKPDQQQQLYQQQASLLNGSGTIHSSAIAQGMSYGTPFSAPQPYAMPLQQQQQLYQYQQMQQMQQQHQKQQLSWQAQHPPDSVESSEQPVASDHEVLQQLIDEGQPLEEATGGSSNELNGAKQILSLLKREFNQTASQPGQPQLPESVDQLAIDSPALPPNSILESLVTSRRANPRKPRSSMPTRKPVLPQTALLKVLNSKNNNKQRKLTDLLDGPGMPSVSDTNKPTNAKLPKPENKKSLMNLLGDTNSAPKENQDSSQNASTDKQKNDSVINLKAGNDLMKLLNGNGNSTNVESSATLDDSQSAKSQESQNPRKSSLLNLLGSQGNHEIPPTSQKVMEPVHSDGSLNQILAENDDANLRDTAGTKETHSNRMIPNSTSTNTLNVSEEQHNENGNSLDSTIPNKKASPSLMSLLGATESAQPGGKLQSLLKNESDILTGDNQKSPSTSENSSKGIDVKNSSLGPLQSGSSSAKDTTHASSQNSKFSLMNLLGDPPLNTNTGSSNTKPSNNSSSDSKKTSKAGLLQLLGQ